MTEPGRPASTTGSTRHSGAAYEDHLTESRDWWKSEWEHKNREAEALWVICLVLGVMCGVSFFLGTVIG